MTQPKTVNCPECQKVVVWEEASKYRPFCSNRCKLIDFGEWATEKNAIPVEPAFDEDLELAAREGLGD